MHIPMPLAAKAAAAALFAVDLSRRGSCTPTITHGVNADATLAAVRHELGASPQYSPTPYLDGVLGGHAQTIFYGLKVDEPELCPHMEDTWRTADGGSVGLAWPEAPPLLPNKTPVVLILPGLCGSIDGTGHSLNAVLDRGLRPVVLHARGCGHDLTSPCFNLFGSTDDVRAAIGRIEDAYPGAPIGIYSISAGTALMVRYLGEEGSDTPVVAGVANCPGYDIGVCMTRVGWLYDGTFYLGVLKKHWLGGANGEILRAHDSQACERMERASDMHSFMVAASPFAVASGSDGGIGSPPTTDSGDIANAFARFLATSNPMGVAHQIAIPTLILNSDDDPVCAAANQDENAPGLLASGCDRAVLLRLPKGGHCCFASGWRAERWGDALAAGFVAAIAAPTDEAAGTAAGEAANTPATRRRFGLQPRRPRASSARMSLRPSMAAEAASEDGAEGEVVLAQQRRAEEDQQVLAIAAPALLNTLLDPFLSVVDTAWVSRLGTTALGAVAASSELFTLCIAASLALRESASSTIARLVAQDKYVEAEVFARRTVQLAVAAGICLGYVLGGPAAPWCVTPRTQASPGTRLWRWPSVTAPDCIAAGAWASWAPRSARRCTRTPSPTCASEHSRCRARLASLRVKESSVASVTRAHPCARRHSQRSSTLCSTRC